MRKQKITPLQDINNFRLNSLEELEKWIRLSCIDISLWGTENAKNINYLWHEIELGEAKLQDKPPRRLISVAKILVYQNKKTLIERKQIINGSRARSRNVPPGEKIRSGESYRDAIKRCLWEELNISVGNFQIIGSTHRITYEEKMSSSYPNLITRYIFHTVKVNIDGLPPNSFWTKESDQESFSKVEQHYWVWQEWSEKLNLQ